MKSEVKAVTVQFRKKVSSLHAAFALTSVSVGVRVLVLVISVSGRRPSDDLSYR
jgi:hypothetical protein